MRHIETAFKIEDNAGCAWTVRFIEESGEAIVFDRDSGDTWTMGGPIWPDNLTYAASYAVAERLIRHCRQRQREAE